jgi:hypothetical protein
VFRGPRRQVLASASFAEVALAKRRVVDVAGIPVTDFRLFAMEAAAAEAENLANKLCLLNPRQQKHILRQAQMQANKYVIVDFHDCISLY